MRVVFMEICALIVSILSFILSIVATVVSCVIANKPYYKKLCLSETFVKDDNLFGLSISNIGRTTVYIERVELIEIKTNRVLGQLFLNNEGQSKLFAIEPGYIRYIYLDLIEENPYSHVADPNDFLKISIFEKNGKISEYKNIFAVG